MEACIQEDLGSKFNVKVFYSLNYLERWNCNERKFILDEFENLIKLDRTDKCFTVKVKRGEDISMNNISSLFYKKCNILL